MEVNALVELRKVRQVDEERESRRLLINFAMDNSEKPTEKQACEDIDFIQDAGFSLAGGLKKDAIALIHQFREMAELELKKAK